MQVHIDNDQDYSEQTYISYGFKLGLFLASEGDDRPFRIKIGASLYLSSDGTPFGSVEVDAIELDSLSEIEVGDIIKQYIQKSDLTNSTGYVTDNISVINITPYTKTKTINGQWTTVYYPANSKSFNMMRGINDRYYLDNNSTPTQPSSSSAFSKTGVSEMILPLYSYKNIYFRLEFSSKYNISLNIRYDDYGLNSSGVEILGKTTNFGPYEWSLYRDTVQIRVAPQYNANGYTPTRSVITVTELRDTTPYVYTINAEYTCAKNDFSFDLAYLATNFMWESISFYTKNQISFNNSSITVEDYNRKRTDVNYRHRQIYTAKSDYLTKDQANDALLFGLAQAFKIVYKGAQWEVNANTDARLLNKSVKILSNNNSPMVQIEVELEISDQIKIA